MDPFSQLVDEAFTEAFDEVESTPLYGVKLIFSHVASDKLQALIVPMVSHSESRIVRLQERLSTDLEFRALFVTWFNLSHMHCPDMGWNLLASSVVKLAPIPF
jgi:hypothetical protein